jgi:hypothetical protein
MDDYHTVKIALAIVCSLLLVLAQAMAVSVPTASANVAKPDCGCGGKMSCCQRASAPQPLAATVPASAQNQLLSPVPAAVVWVLAAAGNPQIFPTVSPVLSVGAAPIFARHCAWLL